MKANLFSDQNPSKRVLYQNITKVYFPSLQTCKSVKTEFIKECCGHEGAPWVCEPYDYIRDTGIKTWHLSGSAAQGSVTDENFAVYGTQNLRVVDASVYNTNWRFNPQGAIMAIARAAINHILS